MSDHEQMKHDLATAKMVTNETRAASTVARVAAEAQVSQAVSLAIIADALDTLVATLFPVAGESPAEAEQQWPKGARSADPTDRDWTIGDVVTAPGSTDELHVDAVGIDQGGTFLSLIDAAGRVSKVWAEHATFIRHDVDPAPAEPVDPIDADFAEASNAKTKGDAFAAAKKAAKKAKS